MIEIILKNVFLCINGLLYICFLLADCGVFYPASGVNISAVLKYISICTVFAGSVYLEIRKKTVQTRILCAALAFTIFADYFLLFTEDYLPGLCSFCIVQIFYMQLTDVRAGIKKQRLWLRALIAAGVIVSVLPFLKSRLQTVELVAVAAAVFYAVLFICNIIQCLRLRGFDRFTIGMLLFFMCDINVLLFNLPSFFTLGEGIRFFCLNIAAFLMWFFYLPSKIFILSSEL